MWLKEQMVFIYKRKLKLYETLIVLLKLEQF